MADDKYKKVPVSSLLDDTPIKQQAVPVSSLLDDEPLKKKEPSVPVGEGVVEPSQPSSAASQTESTPSETINTPSYSANTEPSLPTTVPAQDAQVQPKGEAEKGGVGQRGYTGPSGELQDIIKNIPQMPLNEATKGGNILDDGVGSPWASSEQVAHGHSLLQGFAKEFNKSVSGTLRLADYAVNKLESTIGSTFFGKDFEAARKTMADAGIGGSPFAGAADLVDRANAGAKDVPDNVVGAVVGGVGGIIPDLLGMALVPEVKVGGWLAKYGVQGVDKFAMYLAGKEGTAAAQAAEGGTPDQQMLAPLEGAAKGFTTGLLFNSFGKVSGKIGEGIAGKIVPKAVTTTEHLNRAIAQGTASTLSNALMFGGYSGLEELAQTGKITSKNVATNFGIGLALGAKDLGKLTFVRGMQSFIATPREQINKVAQSPATPEQMKAMSDEALAELNKSVQQAEPIDQFKLNEDIFAAQQRLGLPNEPEVQISAGTLETLAKLQRGEPVTNELLSQASTELYQIRKGLEGVSKAPTRKFTTDQIFQKTNALGNLVETLENAKQTQTENNAFLDAQSNHVVSAVVHDNLATLKAFTDEVINNTEEVKSAIRESDLPDEAKNELIDKVNTVAIDNDPRTIAAQPLQQQIQNLEQQRSELQRAQTDSPVKTQKIADINQQIGELNGQVRDIVQQPPSGTPSPPPQEQPTQQQVVAETGTPDRVQQPSPARVETPTTPTFEQFKQQQTQGRFTIVGSRIRGEETEKSDYDLLAQLTPEEAAKIPANWESSARWLPQEIIDKYKEVREQKGKDKTGDILVAVPINPEHGSGYLVYALHGIPSKIKMTRVGNELSVGMGFPKTTQQSGILPKDWTPEQTLRYNYDKRFPTEAVRTSEVSTSTPTTNGQKEEGQGLLGTPEQPTAAPPAQPVHTTADGIQIHNDRGELVMYDADGKQIPKIDRHIPLKKNGIVQEYKSGQRKGEVIMKPVYNKKYTKAKHEYLNSIEFDNGKTVQPPEEIGPNEYDRYIIDNSENPQEIIDLYERASEDNRAEMEGSREWYIAESLGTVTKESFDRWMDRILYEDREDGLIQRVYFRKPGHKDHPQTLDQVSQSASMAMEGSPDGGDSITPEEVGQFILNHPGGVRDYYNRTSETMDAASSKFTELTGVKLDKDVIQIARNKRNLKVEYDDWVRKQSMRVTPELLKTLDDPITLESLPLYKSIFTPEEYKQVKEALENGKIDDAAEEVAGGTEGPRPAPVGAAGELQAEAKTRIEGIDREIADQQTQKRRKIDALNNRTELPIDTGLGVQDDAKSAIGKATKKYDDKITLLQREKDKLLASMGERAVGDQAQQDLFNQSKQGGQDAISQSNPTSLDVQEPPANGQAVGGGNAVGKEVAEEGKAPGGEEVTPPNRPIAQQFKSVSDKLRSMKVDKGLDNPQAMGISDVDLWNKALDIAADIIEKTGDFAQAMSDGLKVITNKADRDKFRAAINELKDSPEPATIRHADTEAIRNEFDLGEYVKTPQKLADLSADARRIIDAGYNVNELIARVDRGEPITATEQMILGEYVLGLREKARTDPSEENIKLLEDALETSDEAGSFAGLSLRFRQQLFDPEASVAEMMIDNKRKLGVEKLTPEQEAQNRKEFDEIDALKKQYEEALKKAQEEAAKLRAEKSLSEHRKSGIGKRKLTEEEYNAEKQRIVNNIKDKWNKSRLATMSSFVVPVPYANQLRAIAPDVIQLTRLYLDKGIHDLKEITKNIRNDFGIPELTDKDIHDIIAGEYNEPRKTRTELSTRLQNLKREAKYINELDALQNGRVPKTEEGKIKRNKQASDVKKKIDDLRREQGIGRFSEEAKLEVVKNRMKAEIDRIEKELASSKPIDTKRKEPIKLDKEGQDIQNKLISARHRRQARILQEKYASRTWRQKVGKLTLDIINGATRGAMATADVSMALLQNGAIAFTHPVYWGKAFGGALKDMVNEKRYQRWMADQEADPKFHIAKKAGLSVTDPKDPTLVAAEELFQSNLLDKIPLLGKPIKIAGKNYGGITQASSRVFASMSNRIRINMFYDLIDQWEQQGKTIHNSPELYKATARLINAATGRAKFGKFEHDARAIANLLWSPRMYASQIELLTAPVNPYYWKAPKEVKVQLTKDILKYVGVSMALMTLAKLGGAEVEDDPRSKDFGKIKIGNTRIGMPGGMTQWIVLASQLGPSWLGGGRIKSTVSGKVKDLGPGFAESSRWDVFARFVRGKLAPSLAMGYDLMDGRTYMGDDVLTLNHAIQYTTPLSIRSAVETAKNEDVPTGIWTGALASTGLPVQTYSPTGVYPSQDFGYGKKWFNALGENKGEYDKQVWDFARQTKTDLTPPLRSGLKQYDPESGKVFKLDREQYSEFVKERGDVLKSGLKSIATKAQDEKQVSKWVGVLMESKYADGEKVFKDREVAKKVLFDVLIPKYINKVERKANEAAKSKVIDQKVPTQNVRDIMDILREYQSDMEGN